jgi:acetyltransferase-like isoleucine patch superfamily enzyme
MTARRAFTGVGQAIAEDVKLGRDVRISSFVNLYGCEVGDESTIGAFVEVQSDVVIGGRCKIGSHTFICSGVTIGFGTFVGHGVMFTNDKYPMAVGPEGEVLGPDGWTLLRTSVGKRVSIGSQSTILGGVSIGDGAVIGAGSVVTSDIPSGAKAYGVPARVVDLSEE